jgi:hypothetical protein
MAQVLNFKPIVKSSFPGDVMNINDMVDSISYLEPYVDIIRKKHLYTDPLIFSHQ